MEKNNQGKEILKLLQEKYELNSAQDGFMSSFRTQFFTQLLKLAVFRFIPICLLTAWFHLN